MAFLIDHENVSSILKIGGEFNYKTNLALRNDRELYDYFAGLEKKFGRIFSKRELGLNIHHWVFGDRAIYPSHYWREPLSYHATDEIVRIDELDHKILRVIASTSITSPRQIAIELGKPIATVHYRLKSLKSKGVLKNFTFELDGIQASLSNFILRIFNVDIHHQQELLNYAARTPEIAYMSKDIGGWDFQVGISVANQEKASQVVGDIREVLSGGGVTIECLPMFKNIKIEYYPFKSWSSTSE